MYTAPHHTRRMTAAVVRLLAFCAAPTLLACGGDPGGQACPAIAAANFNVTVIDKVSGLRICDATVEATEAASGEKATLMSTGTSSSCTYSGGFYERPGTFSLTVSKAGFTAQTKSDVFVTKGVCNVTAAQVTFQL